MTKYKAFGKQPKPKKIELPNSKNLEALLVFMDAGLMPFEDFKGVNFKWESKCMNCGAIVSPRFADVKGGNGGCKPCSVEKTRLSADVVNAEMKKYGFEPIDSYVNSNTPWKSKCLKCGEIVSPSLHNIRAGHGCIYCQDRAFNFNDPSYFYIMFHQDMHSLKVGIGNTTSNADRIKTHISDGWELLKRYDFDKGDMAMKVEKKVLKWIRKDLKLPIHLTKEFFKRAGHTETVDADELDLPTLISKVEQVIKGLQE